MRRLLLIANPSARGFTGAALREVTRLLARNFEVETEWPDGPEASRLAAAKAAAASYDVVVAMGGDGVTHHVANGLVGSGSALAIIPAGTTNVLARIIGVPRRAKKAAAVLHRWRPRPLQTVRVKADDDDPFHATFALGIGYDAAVLDRAERRPHRKNAWGPIHYARSALAELGRHSHATIRVAAHNRRSDGAAVSIQVQDHYTYFGPLPFAFGGAAPGGFNVLVARRVGPATVNTVAAMATRRLETGRAGTDVWTDVTTLTATAEPPAPLQADGEPHGVVSHVEVTVADRRLLVMRP